MSLKQESQKIDTATKTIRGYLPRLRAPKIIRNIFFYIWGGVLVITPIAFFLSNLFFDFYYSFPEVPKYIKTAGAQVAMQTNAKINSILESEHQQILANINPKGSWVGVITNKNAGNPDPFRVFGGLLALKTNTEIGAVRAKPIYFTTAYQKGIRSSYTTGIKYYDLDFNLNVKGSQKGIFVSNTGDEGAKEINLFTASLGLIEESDRALRIDIDSFLNQSIDREYALRSYLIHLKGIEASVKHTGSKVNKEVVRLENEETSARKMMEETESNFFAALNKFDQNRSQDNLGQFIQDKQQTVDKKANLQAMIQIERYFDAYHPLLTERIKAIEANRDALVHGIRVVAFKDVDLGLIRIGD